MYKTPVEGPSPEKCGSVHPNYPELVCVKFGKCEIDAHMGILEHKNYFNEVVVWGRAYQDRGLLSVYKIILIKEDDDNADHDMWI